MNHVILLAGLLFLELVYGNWIGSGYFLLFYPFFLFLDGRSLPKVLTGGFIAGFLVETIHGQTPGSVLVGIGVAIFLTHLTVGLINWSLPLVQLFGVGFFLLTVFVVRVVFLTLLYGQFHVPVILPWVVTLFLSVLGLLVRWRTAVATPRGERLAS